MLKFNYKRSLLILMMSAFLAFAYAESYYRDVTAKYMTDSAFIPGWQGALTNVGDSVGEVYNGAFNLYQVLYDMPAGEYTLTATAFYRCGTNEYSQENMTDGRNHFAYLYLGTAEVIVKGLFDDGHTAPNTQKEAAEAFGRGEYLNEVTYSHPGGDLVLGIKNLGGYEDEWCAFDNFKLTKGSVDYTHLIVNADFSEALDRYSPAWNVRNIENSDKLFEADKGGGVYRKVNCPPYNLGQRLDLPAGTYRFSALTFLRYGGAGNYDGKIITCKGGWELIDSDPSPKQWYEQNLYNDDDTENNAYLYMSMNEEKPTSMKWGDWREGEMTQATDKRVRLLGPWEICNGDYASMPENETRGTADGTEIVPAYATRNVIPYWTDSGLERESAAAFVNNPEKWRQYVEFTLTEPTKVWVGIAKDSRLPRQFWNPLADFKLEKLCDPDAIITDFEYGGIMYTVIDPDARTCQTKAGRVVSINPGVFESGNVYEGDLAIPEQVFCEGKEYTVIGIGDYGFYGCNGLITVSLPETLASIGCYAFSESYSLSSINLPQGLNFVNHSAFGFCKNLETIVIPSSLTKILDDTFEYCSGLTSVSFPETLEYIGPCAFEGCSSLTSVSLPNSLSSIGSDVFKYCTGLTSISLPNTLTTINGHLFMGCTGLTNIALPETVTSIEWCAFASCTGLTSITLPNSLTRIAEMVFLSCTNLTSVHLPATLKTIGYSAFENASNLSTIIYDAEVPISITKNVFDNIVYENATLTMPNAALADVMDTDSWNQFKHIVAKDGKIPADVSAGDEFEYNGIYYTVIDPEARTCQTKPGYTDTPEGQGTTVYSGNRQCSGDLNIPETVSDGSQTYTVVAIGDCGFSSSTITSVSFPSTLTSIGEYAFFACHDLTFMDWPATVTTLSRNVFTGCDHLYSIQLPETLERISTAAFSSCAALDTLYLPSHLIEVEEYAVTNCDALRKVNIAGAQTQLANCAFWNLPNMVSISLAGTFDVSQNPFVYCPAIASLEWKNNSRLPREVINYFDNPNLLIYVEDLQYAPQGMTKNIVVNNEANGGWECMNLELTQGYPFYAEHEFVAASSSMTMDFNQTTPLGVSGGWETIVLPFNVSMVRAHNDQDDLVSFANLTDINTQLPYWLYEANSTSEWKLASSIRASIPYIIAMPNNDAYDPKYNISGPVTFYGPEGTYISMLSTTPYSLTWPSGHQFRSLWIPLTYNEAQQAMGLNVGIDNLVDDEGKILLPGSAFHVDVTPRPLEAYVTRNGSRMSLPVMGGQTHVELLSASNGLGIDAQDGSIWLKSEYDRTVSIYRIDGVCVGTVNLKAGDTFQVSDLSKGLYIVAGQKIILK